MSVGTLGFATILPSARIANATGKVREMHGSYTAVKFQAHEKQDCLM